MTYTLEKLNKMVDDANESGGSLYLSSLTSIPEGFNPTVGGSLDLSSLTSIPEGFNPTVGGYLDLSSLTSIPEGFNPTVGGSLDLSSLTSIPEGFNPTVGGSLDLSSLTSIPEGFNPTVGGYLDLSSLTSIKRKKVKVKLLREGDYVPGKYLYADGILTHIKRKRTFGDYTYYQGKIPGRNVIFDGEHYAHCKTFKDGVLDLNFKKAKDRGSEQYKELTLDSAVTKNEAITMYRIITGACRAGTEQFLSTIKEFKEKYTVRELIEITRGQYGAESFKSFFERCAND